MRKVVVSLLLVGLALSLPVAANAVGSSGFELQTNSALSNAKSNAVVADPQEAATIVFNPAGLTALDGVQLNSSFTMGMPEFRFDRADGEIGEESSITGIPVPAFFLSSKTPLSGFNVGFGVNAPFGLQTHYSSDGNFRYLGYYNELKTVAYNFAAAYEIAPWLSFGGSWSYVESGLKQNGKFNSNFITSAIIPGTTGLADASFELDTKGDGYGWTLGLLLTPDERNTIGFIYRSQIRLHYSGVFDVDNLQGFILPLVFGGSSFHTDATTDVTLPDSITLGYHVKLNDRLAMEFDFTYTGWSTFDHIDIAFDTTNDVLNALEPVEENYSDTFNLNIGMTYKINDHWNLLAGYFYYQMAANEKDYSNVIPDGDRHGATIGLQYVRPKFTIEVAYVAEFINAGDIDTDAGLINGADIDGNYDGLVNILTVSSSLKF